MEKRVYMSMTEDAIYRAFIELGLSPRVVKWWQAPVVKWLVGLAAYIIAIPLMLIAVLLLTGYIPRWLN